MKMEARQYFNSTSIEYASYDKEEKILTIKFVNSKEYRYKDVPERVYNEMVDAPSAGKFFQTFIRNQYEVIND